MEPEYEIMYYDFFYTAFTIYKNSYLRFHLDHIDAVSITTILCVNGFMMSKLIEKEINQRAVAF